jgi:membrane fusion protein, heavy metal efflux system
MNFLRATSTRVRWYVVLGLVLVTGTATVVAIYGFPGLRASTSANAEGTASGKKKPLSVTLLKGMPNTIEVPEAVRKGLGITQIEIAERAKQSRPLVLPGSTSLDPTRIMRVKTRFNAEVVEISKVPTARRTPSGETVLRELRTGDKVEKGQVLAVVWSIDVGSRKSDLVDALVQLWLDEARLRARIELWKNGNLPEDTLNQTRRDVVSDQNAADRAERTLRTWNVPEREIEAVREEAKQAYQRKGKRDKEKERLWARSELVAPRDGTIVEQNVAVGEYVADNTINLFTIADVDRMLVLASPPEDHLPTLLSLDPDHLRWTLRTVGLPPTEGPVDEIGYILDSSQHTAVLKGRIDNPKGRLRAGQYVSATIDLPPPPGVVEVPLTALAEDGKQSFVFVQADPKHHWYTMRRVLVTHRFEKTAFVRSSLENLSEEEAKKLAEEQASLGLEAPLPLQVGDRYLTSGVLELRAALEDRVSKAKKKAKDE